ncbi:tripeptide aminopeptidase [Clostridium tetanomorphum]|uniref:Peptidase T n=1 Tax=Clostridium tetanomorphum TaxID=1553 RepID=A0A923EDM3_CLOTT|nr:peptidase T [Clostridium tetanomorphum]KAJ50323.1 peptidase T [Clostridium tetanomorphum DSM 665]MBC2400192.1 peptidase T [Clostridium tetanomorphum]MBP1866065.1 tripeptide aminopeptidase [Clostridium tetanomorphum]NRS83256.1 tripeptide aminopeptidase [Clostridium tetanomorphum]NRZ98646.1 tripeptide aminopeptidase [Clostridium tetanomorphum]
MSEVVERFLKYVSFNTKSDEDSKTTPTTIGQMILAEELGKELREIGLENVSVDENGYVMGELSSNIDKKVPKIGFIAHMDTSPDMSGENVNPKFVENYNGEDILLNEKENIILSPKDFPELKNYIGKTLITTDGDTLLGADDKAGVAEIIAAMKYLVDNPHIKHGKICVAFTPDEEVGAGADHFNIEKFGADFAYTIDGGTIGELEFENFNAAGAKVCIKGRNVHPGSAKGKMINSMTIAGELIMSLPENEVPERTEGYEGFFHLTSLNGEVEETKLEYIIRDFDKDSFNKRKEFLKEIVKKLNKKYGEDTVILNLNDQYYNMKEKVEPVKYIVDLAYKAIKQVGVTPNISPIRGGTDGARLSFMGLPTPNIFTGGHNFHGRYEYIPIYAMEKAVEVILKIVELSTEL